MLTQQPDQTLASWISTLLSYHKKGNIIRYYRKDEMPATEHKTIRLDHLWNFEDNVYSIVVPREYVIRLWRNGTIKHIEEYQNDMTRSDFGSNSDGSDMFLVREIFPQDM